MTQPSPAPDASPEEQLRALYQFLHHEPHGVTEVRIIATKGTGSKIRGIGFFDNEESFVQACLQWDQSPHNVYAGLNPRDISLFDRAPNEIRALDSGASADDVTAVMFLGVDIDPVRPKGEASTDAELQAALEVRDAIAAWARTQGFPPALLGMSGNGGHLVFSFPPVPPADVTEQLRAFTQEVRKRFGDPRVAIDSTFDAPRVWKVYGTLSKKGENTEARPWRRARIDALRPGPSQAFLEYIMHLQVAAAAQPLRKAPAGTTVTEPAANQPGLQQTLEQCLFMQHAADHAASLSEPLWYAMVTNLVRFEGGPEAIHKLSEPYPSYSRRETETKIRHAQENTAAPHTCQWLGDNGFPCPEMGRCPARSPAGLGAKLYRQARIKEAVGQLLVDMEAAFNEGKPNFLLAIDRAEVLAPLNDLDYQKVRAKIKAFAPKIRITDLDRLRLTLLAVTRVRALEEVPALLTAPVRPTVDADL